VKFIITVDDGVLHLLGFSGEELRVDRTYRSSQLDLFVARLLLDTGMVEQVGFTENSLQQRDGVIVYCTGPVERAALNYSQEPGAYSDQSLEGRSHTAPGEAPSEGASAFPKKRT